MYRSNYLVKTPSGVYKSKQAVYRSDDTTSDFVDQSHTHQHYLTSFNLNNTTKISFSLGSNTQLSLRPQYV